MKALVQYDNRAIADTRGRKSAKLYTMPISSSFSVIPSNWMNFKTSEGRRINVKALTTLWTLVRRANYMRSNSIEIDYSFLITQAFQGNCSQKTISRYLTILATLGLIEKEVKHLFNSEKKLIIKIDFKKLKSLESGDVQKIVVDKSVRHFCTVLSKKIKAESKEIEKTPQRVLSISKKEKSIKKKKIERTKNIETSLPLPKPSFENDFGASSEPRQTMPSEAEVVKGVFNQYEPPEEATRAEMMPMNSTLPPSSQHKHQHQQTTKRTEIEPMAKSYEYQEQHEQQNQRNLTQAVNHEIQKCFNAQISEELQENLETRRLAPDKIGLKFKAKVELNESNKARLRECVRTVYGHAIKIVQMPKFKVVVNAPEPERTIKLRMPTPEETEKRSASINIATSTPANSKWNQIKIEVLHSVYLNAAEQLKATLDKVLVVNLVDRKLHLKASWLACQTLENHQAIIEKIAAKHDVDIELENTTEKDTLYFPWTYPSQDLPPLTLEKTKD